MDATAGWIKSQNNLVKPTLQGCKSGEVLVAATFRPLGSQTLMEAPVTVEQVGIASSSNAEKLIKVKIIPHRRWSRCRASQTSPRLRLTLTPLMMRVKTSKSSTTGWLAAWTRFLDWISFYVFFLHFFIRCDCYSRRRKLLQGGFLRWRTGAKTLPHWRTGDMTDWMTQGTFLLLTQKYGH